MLDVRSVSRSYGDFRAVDDVSFTVSQGEIVGLLGHNGAGKTTIMKMLSGFLEPDSGSILFKDSPILEDRSQLRLELGYLPENLPVYPELSVASYLDYAAEIKGIRRAEKRLAIRRVIEATDLGARLLSPIATLSRGLKQRVGVAQAILGKPSLLILDEPTNGLDPAQTELMRELIRSLTSEATIILSTHIMQEVEAMCDRALIVKQGKLAVDASLSDLQRGSRIRLVCNADVDQLLATTSPLTWISSIKPTNRPWEYLIPIPEGLDAGNGIAEVVRLLVEENIAIQGISPDVRDLQTLFLEVNAVAVPTASKTDGKSESAQSSANAEHGEVNHVA